MADSHKNKTIDNWQLVLSEKSHILIYTITTNMSNQREDFTGEVHGDMMKNLSEMFNPLQLGTITTIRKKIWFLMMDHKQLLIEQENQEV